MKILIDYEAFDKEPLKGHSHRESERKQVKRSIVNWLRRNYATAHFVV